MGCLQKETVFTLDQRFSLGAILPIVDTGQYLGTSVVVTLGVLLASREWGPGILLISPTPPVPRMAR